MKRSLAILLITLVLSAQLAAQGLSQLMPGDRVRVWTKDIHKRAGQITALTADTVVLRLDRKTDSLSIPLASLTRVDVSRGRRTSDESARAAGGRGALVGAGTAIVVAFTVPDRPGLSRGPAAINGAMMGSFLGMVVGGIVGKFRRGEKWERVW